MHFKKKKKKKRRKSKVFRRSLQLWMMNTPYTGEKYIRNRYGGLTRQKRSKETVSSHKSLGVSKQKTTSKVYICMYVCMYTRAVSGEVGLEDNVLEGTGSEQNGLSVLLNWNLGGNCWSETSAIFDGVCFFPHPIICINYITEFEGRVSIGRGTAELSVWLRYLK